MKYITIIFILLTQICCGEVSDSTSISSKIEKLVDQIADDGIYKSSAVGYGGARTDQWERFIQLKEEATSKELIFLTNHENSAVKCYAFQALAERKDSRTFEVLLKHLKDNADIETFQGCIMSSQLVGDFFLEIVTPQYISLEAYKLNIEEKNQIDSLLLFDSGIKLSAKSSLLQNIEPIPEYYNRIKEIYLQENNPTALIALSKFKRIDDKKLIIEWLDKKDTDDQYYGLRAVRNYPDSSFFPFLKKIQQQEIAKPTGFNYSLIRMLYLTTVQYKNQESKELIENTLNNAKKSTLKYHSEFIWLALTKYPDPIYEGLKDEIKISDWKKDEFDYWMNKPDR